MIAVLLAGALALQEDDPVRARIWEFERGLQRIKDEEERIPLVRKFFASLGDSRAKIAALDMLDRRYVYSIPDSIESEILAPLVRDPDLAVRTRAACTIAYTGRSGEFVDELLALLGESDLDAKQAALAAMGRSDHERFLAPIRWHLSHADPILRRAASSAFAHWTVAQSRHAVTLLADPDAEVRAGAAIDLAGSARSGVQEILKLLWDADARVRVGALRALSMLRTEPDAVARLLRDPEASVRGQAALALGAMDARQHLDGVAALLKDRDTRQAAAWALAGFRDPSVLRHLSPLLADADPQIRSQVRDRISMWAAERDPDALARQIDDLIGRLGADDPETRDRAQQDLMALGRQATNALARAADAEGSAERKSRARATLEEILWGPGTRALKLMLEKANASPERRFELTEATSAESRRWFPECRVMTLQCAWQRPELSSIVWPRSYVLVPGLEEPLEGAYGLNRLLDRYLLRIESLEDARQFVALMQSLGMPDGTPRRDLPVVTKTEGGYEGRRSHGQTADVYSLSVEGGRLMRVGFERR